MDLGSVGRHDALTERLGRNTRGGEKPPDSSFISSLLVALVVLVLVLVFARTVLNRSWYESYLPR